VACTSLTINANLILFVSLLMHIWYPSRSYLIRLMLYVRIVVAYLALLLLVMQILMYMYKYQMTRFAYCIPAICVLRTVPEQCRQRWAGPPSASNKVESKKGHRVVLKCIFEKKYLSGRGNWSTDFDDSFSFVFTNSCINSLPE